MIATGDRLRLCDEVVVRRRRGRTSVPLAAAPREVDEVEDEEQRDDDAGPAHRAAGEVGGDVVALALVLHRPGLAVHHA